MPGGAFPPVGPWVTVPHLLRYYAPLRLPPAHLGSLRLSLASRYRACFTAFVVSLAGSWPGSKPPDHARALWSPGPPIRDVGTETGGSPTFPRYPSEDMPRSQTPVVSCALAALAHRIVAFRRMQTVGFCLDTAETILLTTTLHISGLNDAACLLAHSSFVRPLLGWHVEFAPDRLARLWSGGT